MEATDLMKWFDDESSDVKYWDANHALNCMKFKTSHLYANAITSTAHFKFIFVWNIFNQYFLHQGSDQRAYH